MDGLAEWLRKLPLPAPVRTLVSLLQETILKWLDDDVFTLAAALAYYATFSIAPVVVVAISIAGLFFGRHGAEMGILNQLRDLMGNQGSQLVRAIVTSAEKPGHSITATGIGIVALIFGASGVFVQLDKSINKIWGVPASHISGIVAILQQRFISFAMVVGVGFLLLISLVLTAFLAAADGYLRREFPFWKEFGGFSELASSLVLFTVLFASIFKALPRVPVRWHHVWMGAGVSAVLFEIGKRAIGFYLKHSQIASGFGAAGSMAVLLLWIFYGALILLLGAEFTCVYAGRTQEKDARDWSPRRKEKS